MTRSGLVGIEIGRVDRKVKGYHSRPFGCEVGSQFHQYHVSRSPPIMPDGRVSQVRFEALAFQRRTFPSAVKFKRWCTCAPPSNGLLIPSFLALTAVWYTRFYQAEPAPVVGTTKCPESLCLTLVLPSSGRRVPPPPRTLLPVPSSYGLIRQSPVALPYFGVGLVRGVCAGCYQPCCHRDLPDVISANLSSDA